MIMRRWGLTGRYRIAYRTLVMATKARTRAGGLLLGSSRIGGSTVATTTNNDLPTALHAPHHHTLPNPCRYSDYYADDVFDNIFYPHMKWYMENWVGIANKNGGLFNLFFW